VSNTDKTCTPQRTRLFDACRPARSEDQTEALQSGCEMHLAKPVDPGEIVASVATLARRVETEK
jgi:DNA-binding response OmpR family regulator